MFEARRRCWRCFRRLSSRRGFSCGLEMPTSHVYICCSFVVVGLPQCPLSLWFLILRPRLFHEASCRWYNTSEAVAWFVVFPPSCNCNRRHRELRLCRPCGLLRFVLLQAMPLMTFFAPPLDSTIPYAHRPTFAPETLNPRPSLAMHRHMASSGRDNGPAFSSPKPRSLAAQSCSMHLSQRTSRRIRGKQGFSKSRPCWKELTSAKDNDLWLTHVIQVHLPVSHVGTAARGSCRNVNCARLVAEKWRQTQAVDFARVLGDRELPRKTVNDALHTIEESVLLHHPTLTLWTSGSAPTISTLWCATPVRRLECNIVALDFYPSGLGSQGGLWMHAPPMWGSGSTLHVFDLLTEFMLSANRCISTQDSTLCGSEMHRVDPSCRRVPIFTWAHKHVSRIVFGGSSIVSIQAHARSFWHIRSRSCSTCIIRNRF